MLGNVSIDAFADELEKIAKEVPTSEALEKAEEILKPGDILATRPRGSYLRSMGKGHILLRPLLVALQGTPYTHTSLYVGDGKVIDAAEWKGKAKVHSVPLEKFVERYRFKVLRVSDATLAEKKDAVEWAKKQVGKAYDTAGLIRLALPVAKSKVKERVRQEKLKALICSQLISNAYPNQSFGASRKIEHVRPVDIQKSRHTKTVAVVK